MNEHILGIDLGSVNDFTSIGVVQSYGEEVEGVRDGVAGAYWQWKGYRLLHLERHVGVPYTDIVRHIKDLLETDALKGSRLVLDSTGVGRPVVDLLVDEGLKRVYPVVITGGEDVSSVWVNGRKEFRVPKRDLVGTLQVLLQNQQLKIPSTIELKNELVAELQNFKVKLNAETGHASFEHWRSSDHDDLVLAVALACWFAEYSRPHAFKPVLI